jgi:hypothetical protein
VGYINQSKEKLKGGESYDIVVALGIPIKTLLVWLQSEITTFASAKLSIYHISLMEIAISTLIHDLKNDFEFYIQFGRIMFLIESFPSFLFC